MKARYNATENSLTELPQMECPIAPNPEMYDGNSRALSQDVHDFMMAKDLYNAHVASLRTIPCHKPCKEVFKDQEVYEEGKDYQLKEDYWRPETEEEYHEALIDNKYELPGKPSKVFYAFPLVPVKSEDEEKMWYQVKELMMSAMEKGLTPEEWVGLVNKLYIIKKR